MSIDVSGRHVHLSEESIEILFGKGYKLTKKKSMGDSPAFTAEERVAITGPKGSFPKVVILGPIRPYVQVEISKTDARVLGLNPPIRLSGELEGTPGLTITGPKGELALDKGVIVARRHVHLCEEDAQELGVADLQRVSLRIAGESRSLVFDDVVCCVKGKRPPGFVIAAHIDTDEANAANIDGHTIGELII